MPVGATDVNRAITDLSVTAGPGGIQARVTIESTGGPDATQILRIDVDGVTVLTEEVEIPSGEVYEDTFELPGGARVAAFLDGEDLLSYDNQRYAAAPAIGALKGRVHGDATFFVDQLLAAIPEVDTEVGVGEEIDFEVFVGTPVPAEQSVPFVAIDVPGGVPGIVPVGRTSDPIPTLVANDPILEDVDVSRIAIAETQILEIRSGEVLLGAPGAPLLVRGELDGTPFFYFAFTLEQSNLPVNIAYPILGARMVGELATAGASTGSLTVGEPIPVGSRGGVVWDPRSSRSTLSVGDSSPIADQAGFWVLQREGEDPIEIPVNPSVSESQLRPLDSLPELRPSPPGADEELRTATVARTLLPWFVGALVVVLGVELWVSHRVRGVPVRQWRWGLAARALIASLLALALLDPAISRTSNDVTTVFVVDASASMGSSLETARSWVQAAITDAGDGAWSVVEYGGDARVGTPVGRDPYRPARGVDRESTNVARGLRLGESILTGETRERIVLVSDGRSNAGDLQSEVDRLKTLGVVVDVHTVAPERRTDAAVAGIDLPNTVNADEVFEATVEVLSTISGTAIVELLDENGLIEQRSVEVTPGSNLVTFPVEAGSTGLQKLTARVSLPGDDIVENDETVNAVEISGPASVLIVEGADADGSGLADVLESRGLVAEVVGVGALPGLQELAAHRALVLVDVSVRDLSVQKMTTIATYVRELGRGLVVVGGTHSYGLGGYRDTELEAILPVDSEATDALREVGVAEVLLIDTSESMGACHCDEQGIDSSEGGVNKTDISKAGALRAIEALSSTDEVGVLAFSGQPSWVIPLQEFPPRDVIDEGVASLRPFGETRVIPALREAAETLRESDKELKHIILFTDGFTTELEVGSDFVGAPFAGDLVAEVEKLAEEGITVSVVGTGEGAIPALEEVAEVGRGRFYPGRDLNEVPEIFVEETRLASRSYINEGEFYPAVTSTAEAVRDLGSSPPLLGYVATSPKPTADVQLQIGEFADPLLASWRIGLGKVTAWTSDSGDKWGAQWAGWDGYADFWSDVVRDTFPLSGSEGQQLRARIADQLMTITLESSEAWSAGTDPRARISFPDGTSDEIRLDRVSDFEFAAVVPARQGGTYAVGVSVDAGTGETAVLSSIASRSFAAEYLPGEADPQLLTGISTGTGGRGEITPEQAFDSEGLEPGVSEQRYRWWFLLAAAILWPIDVGLRRLRFSRRDRPDPPQRSSGPRPKPTRREASRTR